MLNTDIKQRPIVLLVALPRQVIEIKYVALALLRDVRKVEQLVLQDELRLRDLEAALLREVGVDAEPDQATLSLQPLRAKPIRNES